MHMGIIGLGRMGMNIAIRLIQSGHRVSAYNRTPAKTREIEKNGATGTYSLKELVESLPLPRIVWLMLPAGSVVDEQIDSLYDLLQQGDIIIDGGNTYYKDDLARAERLSQKGICYMDVGVSGGILGLKQGYCLMIGGNKDTFKYLEPIFQSLSYDNGYLYCGRTGAGHFAKMIHNGIEYAMMQAYGEGFELIDASPYANEINYADLAHVWNRGSIIRSWLLELTEKVFRDDPLLLNIRGYVEDSGEGRWTVKEAVDMTVSAPVISMALFERFRSRKEDALSHRLISALRKEFGGHMVKKK